MPSGWPVMGAYNPAGERPPERPGMEGGGHYGANLPFVQQGGSLHPWASVTWFQFHKALPQVPRPPHSQLEK